MISNPQWMGHEPYHQEVGAYIIECPTCGYEPDEQLLIRPIRCPKCHSFTWHRVPRPGMLAGRILSALPGTAEYAGEVW